MKKLRFKTLCVIAGVLMACNVCCSASMNGTPAFPGAQGYGAASLGGRGGEVIYVTTLEDYDPKIEAPIEGSFRKAVNTKGPRTILFKVSGEIGLKTPLRVQEPYITIAGQSSPGGICIRDSEFGISTHDVIIRYMRFRLGEKMQAEYDAFNFINSYNCILDHCSFSWAIDEVLSASEGTSFHNGTFQWCIISEGLAQSYHPKGEHSMGSLLSGDGGLSIHHCLFANNSNRNPRSHYLVLDYRNNVVYNWRAGVCYTRAAPNFINMVGNYFKPGPDTPEARETIAFAPGDDMVNIYLKGNVVDGHPEMTGNDAALVSASKKTIREQLETIIVKSEFDMPSVSISSAEDAYQQVLEGAGATLPVRDAVDIRVIEGVRTGTGRIINSPNDVGGYPDLSTSKMAPDDSDGDGMPDVWEIEHGFDPKNPADGKSDADGDGYTNLEEYLNGTDPRQVDDHGDFDASRILAMGEQAVKMLREKEEVYKEERRQEAEAIRLRKEELKKSTKASLSADPMSGAQKLTLNLNDLATVTLIRIPAGSFMMGATAEEQGEEIEYPRHKVNISRDFYMAETKLTTEQYCAVMGAASKKLNSTNRKEPAPSTTWFEAMDFCEILSAATGQKFRLPTEAEWEYACRAGSDTYFNTGNTITTDQANFNGKEASVFNPAGVSRGKHTDVDMFPPNAWGLYDMHGNESEFCMDKAFRKYTTEEVTDPLNDDPQSSRYVIRGGKAASKAFYVRSAYRYSYTPDVGFSFRLVMELPSK